MARNRRSSTAVDSTEETVALIARARAGDRSAENRIVERHLGPLRRWARGRLPPAARGMGDTEDLVQDTLMRALAQLPAFDAARPGAFQAYLRSAVKNRIIDEARRIRRRPTEVPLVEVRSDRTDPHMAASRSEAAARYERILQRLRPVERALIEARLERSWSYERIAKAFGKPSVDAARMAVSRALQRLLAEAAAPERTRRPPGR